LFWRQKRENLSSTKHLAMESTPSINGVDVDVESAVTL
jgi:hypothetical protein